MFFSLFARRKSSALSIYIYRSIERREGWAAVSGRGKAFPSELFFARRCKCFLADVRAFAFLKGLRDLGLAWRAALLLFRDVHVYRDAERSLCEEMGFLRAQIESFADAATHRLYRGFALIFEGFTWPFFILLAIHFHV